MPVKLPKEKEIIAWADVGSHCGIFMFEAGPVADKYPYLMHIYNKPLPGLRKIRIIITNEKAPQAQVRP